MAKKPNQNSNSPTTKIRRSQKNAEHHDEARNKNSNTENKNSNQQKKSAIVVKESVEDVSVLPTHPPTKPTPEAGDESKTDTQNQKTPTKDEAIIQQTEFMTFEQGTSDDFAALLSGSTTLPEKRRYRVGDEVQATILTIGDTYIYVDLGASYEGIAKTADFMDENGKFPFAPGDTVTFFVTDLRGGAINLGLHLENDGPGIDALEQAFASGLPLEGRVTSVNKGGFVVEFNGVETFCPISQIDIAFTEDPSIHLNQSYHFKVTDIREEGRNIIVSRRALLEKEAKEARKRLLKSLTEGDIVTGKVTRLADFGAFVDIGGVEGLLHISEIAFTRLDHPSELLKVDEELKVQILSIEEDGKKLKISLSRKNCMQDPWEAIYDTCPLGSDVNGEVTRLEAFGAFVEIAPGIEGLVHVSEMSWSNRIRHASDVLSLGDRILVRVKEIDPQRRRVSLSMKSHDADPWTDIEKFLQVGQEVTGTVDKVEDFGAFIQLTTPEVTALLPRSEMNLGRHETPYSKAIKGTEITARVLDIDKARRRMALTLKTADEVADLQREQSGTPANYTETTPRTSTFGTLGDLLRKQLKD